MIGSPFRVLVSARQPGIDTLRSPPQSPRSFASPPRPPPPTHPLPCTTPKIRASSRPSLCAATASLSLRTCPARSWLRRSWRPCSRLSAKGAAWSACTPPRWECHRRRRRRRRRQTQTARWTRGAGTGVWSARHLRDTRSRRGSRASRGRAASDHDARPAGSRRRTQDP